MILHDVCTIKFLEKLDQLDDTTKRTAEHGAVPCEINPINSIEASDGGPLTTRYRFFTTVDLIALIEQQAAEWKASYSGSRGASLSIVYKGKTLSLEAGIEVHRVLSRFHHMEAIVKDFNSLGV